MPSLVEDTKHGFASSTVQESEQVPSQTMSPNVIRRQGSKRVRSVQFSCPAAIPKTSPAPAGARHSQGPVHGSERAGVWGPGPRQPPRVFHCGDGPTHAACSGGGGRASPSLVRGRRPEAVARPRPRRLPRGRPAAPRRRERLVSAAGPPPPRRVARRRPGRRAIPTAAARPSSASLFCSGPPSLASGFLPPASPPTTPSLDCDTPRGWLSGDDVVGPLPPQLRASPARASSKWSSGHPPQPRPRSEPTVVPRLRPRAATPRGDLRPRSQRRPCALRRRLFGGPAALPVATEPNVVAASSEETPARLTRDGFCFGTCPGVCVRTIDSNFGDFRRADVGC